MCSMRRNPHNPFAAPGYLEVVRRFVNTLDIEGGADQLFDRESAQRWLTDWGLLDQGDEVTASDTGTARELREALRALMSADTAIDPGALGVVLTDHGAGDPGARDAEGVLSGVLRRGARPVVVGRTIRFEADGSGIARAMGLIGSIVATAMIEGSWARMKVCSNDACRWAFFDASRNRTSRWCRMETCGNRAKARRYRERHAS
jgi:predicted RNA-binding Zn ribbon-like protein